MVFSSLFHFKFWVVESKFGYRLVFFFGGRYGSLLDTFQRREGLTEKIRGVIIDSGAADPLNSKVFALCVELEFFIRHLLKTWC